MQMDDAVLLTAQLSEGHGALYLGRDDASTPRFGSHEDHLLALGRPRSGKTTGLIIPSVAIHPGPVISTSTRADVVAATANARTRIAEAVGGSVVELVFAGRGTGTVPAVGWSITDGCTDWNVAVDRASVLVQAAMPLADEQFWAGAGSDLLAGCLFGAALRGEDDRMMTLRIKSTDVSAYFATVVDACPEDHQAPFVFGAVTNPEAMAEDTRRSVFATLSSQVLGQFRYESPPPGDGLRLEEFVRGAGTIFIVIPDARAKVLRPLVSAFIEAAAAAWRNTQVQSRANTLLLALDEVANVAPLPNLPSLLASGAGDGIQCLLGMQDPGQAGRWGTEASVIVGGPTHVALFPGLRNAEYLAGLASLLGQDTAYDLQVDVRDGLEAGRRYADESTLIGERLDLERARANATPRLQSTALRRAAWQIAARRRRVGVANRIPDESGGSAVLREVLETTRVRRVPTRRPRLEADGLRAGRPGHFLLISNTTADYRQIQHWRHDPAWATILHAAGT
jgi:type IV secretion system protein VirD4